MSFMINFILSCLHLPAFLNTISFFGHQTLISKATLPRLDDKNMVFNNTDSGEDGVLVCE